MHFVYIVESGSSGNWYYGYSTDVERKIEGHNKGLNTSTKNRDFGNSSFLIAFDSKTEALKFELYLKKSRNKNFIRNRFTENFV